MAYKKQNAIMDTISGTIHPHMYTGHANEGRKKRHQKGGKDREKVVNGEWLKKWKWEKKGSQGTWYRIGGIVGRVSCEYGSQECSGEEHQG